ncbi:DUF4861 family protein [Flagellimonas myxillae]|uniref:DUF4861 family protein n=1 Tax=Flagellimonas myxillae TaxID=2942214 RepID=UPI00201EE95C|nr:DUF4861 family protein [Muricauda myxillae]MCL6266284.1 DUF4861 domain-containing protein [Muricauda myxillae]
MCKKLFVLIGVVVTSCAPKDSGFKFVVQNDLDLPRSFETVELTSEFLGVDNLNNYGIRDVETQEVMVSQGVDTDKDQYADVLLFQPKMEPNSERKFELIQIHHSDRPRAKAFCYSRFVPERMDDYTWENNRVAFRVFGPTAQKMAEEGIAGGTLTSGVDAWLKRVEYPIINKWYNKELNTDGSYHEDDGEGLDNFHVGASRGVGGLAIKKDTTYHSSKNFKQWRTITTGPIRTSFHIEIGDWDSNGNGIKESKTISLDRGSNLSRYEVFLQGTETISAGLSLHENDGAVSVNKKEGWLSYWQPHADSELGMGIVVSPDIFSGHEKYVRDHADLNNVFAHLDVKDGKVIYYAGFGWKKSGQFSSQEEWEHYLSDFGLKISNPLKVL